MEIVPNKALSLRVSLSLSLSLSESLKPEATTTVNSQRLSAGCARDHPVMEIVPNKALSLSLSKALSLSLSLSLRVSLDAPVMDIVS